jgi:hypothetical protein
MFDAMPQSRPRSARRRIGFILLSGSVFFACDSEWRTVHRRLAVGGASALGIASRKADFLPSAAGEVDDGCVGQMRQSLSFLGPVANGGSIAGAARLTVSLRSTRTQLARQFEQGIFISLCWSLISPDINCCPLSYLYFRLSPSVPGCSAVRSALLRPETTVTEMVDFLRLAGPGQGPREPS